MLHESAARVEATAAVEAPVSEPDDRSMAVLQYATAFLAIVVAVLLAAIH